MTIYADRETGACDLFRRCCINRRATKNRKENALPEIKKKDKKSLRVGDQEMIIKKERKNIGGA